jgi:hypothetical protein
MNEAPSWEIFKYHHRTATVDGNYLRFGKKANENLWRGGLKMVEIDMKCGYGQERGNILKK